jgi:hypothetical protein
VEVIVHPLWMDGAADASVADQGGGEAADDPDPDDDDAEREQCDRGELGQSLEHRVHSFA